MYRVIAALHESLANHIETQAAGKEGQCLQNRNETPKPKAHCETRHGIVP
jgi:hypothetical protein